MDEKTPGQMFWAASILFQLNGQAFFTYLLQTIASLAAVMGKHMELSLFVSAPSQRAFIYCFYFSPGWDAIPESRCGSVCPFFQLPVTAQGLCHSRGPGAVCVFLPLLGKSRGKY